MCGRFAIRTDVRRLEELFGARLSGVTEFHQRYNLSPCQYAPVVRAVPLQGRSITMLKWGLVPRWAKSTAVGVKAINARAETIGAKPMFRDAYHRRRCLVLADGFFEWKLVSHYVKQPYFVHFPDDRPFAFAGLWESWKGSMGDIETFTIITTEANSHLAWLHDRMPVILPPTQYSPWLSGKAGTEILIPYTQEDLVCDAVSTIVNISRNDSPECIEPVKVGESTSEASPNRTKPWRDQDHGDAKRTVSRG